MTLPRYTKLHRHWKQHPRAEWLIAGYLGYKPKAESEAAPDFGGFLGEIGNLPGVVKVDDAGLD